MKKILSYLGIILLFLVLSYTFVPDVLSGKRLNQPDSYSWKGMAHETVEWNKAHPDDKTLWTGSMFSGMPTVSICDDFDGDWTKPIYKLLMVGQRPANWLFVSLLGAFLLMLAFGVDKFLAIAGAIAISFCSYNFQIIQVGHNTKMQAIAFMPWVLAAVVFTYKSALKDKNILKTVLGSVLFALALSFQIKANHPQISYYLAIIILIYAVTLLIWTIARKKELFGKFAIASALLLVIGIVGIATNANKLIPTWEYTQQTMRGGSELASSDEGKTKGLDVGYATAWSYGIEETPNLLIPNYNGGSSSGSLKKDSATGELLSQAGYKGKTLNDTLSSLPLYWGPQPFTAGPMYLGAVSIFLFLLGLFLYKGKERWWLLVATIIAILLAWGNHFLWFTKLWYNYAPLYNKFRTVSMALVTLQITVPLLGFIVLDKILKQGYTLKEFRKPAWLAFGITAGFCLIMMIFPSIAGSFTGSYDSQLPEVLADTLADDRKSLLSHDAFRSFIFIFLMAISLLYGYGTLGFGNIKGKENNTISSKGALVVTIAACVLVTVDLFSAGKRYLNSSNFATPKSLEGIFDERTVDKLIHQDEDPNYRVLDLSVDTFNDAIVAYHHKCIGGYSPAKMQRYQDLIEKHIIPEMRTLISTVNEQGTVSGVENNLPDIPVLDMLNCKYIILDPDHSPARNNGAFGNAWFVNSVTPASDVREEIDLLSKVDLAGTAVVGSDYIGFVPENVQAASEGDYINLESYAPNCLKYNYSVSGDRMVVFSEIFYPDGWKAESNGQKLDVFRADWTLRALVLPEGSGELVMRFEPDDFLLGENISRASSILLIILTILSAGGMIFKNKNNIWKSSSK